MSGPAGGALLSLAFLAIGLAVGYMAQRSRMCFVAGLRDWILVRDAELLLGLFAFVATVWLLSSVLGTLGLIHHGMPEFAAAPGGPRAASSGALPAAAGIFNRLFFTTLGGGFLMGALSVAVGGCVLRQHVLFAQGDGNAGFYLLGFYAAVPVFYLALSRLFAWVYG